MEEKNISLKGLWPGLDVRSVYERFISTLGLSADECKQKSHRHSLTRGKEKGIVVVPSGSLPGGERLRLAWSKGTGLMVLKSAPT